MDLKGIIKEQREELENIEKKERILPRGRLQEAEKYLTRPNILAVLGVRRCGKSVFSYLLAKRHRFGYVNFDDERLADITSADLDKILEAWYGLYGDIDYIVLDEIQNVPQWELFANRLRRTKKVILTGSNSGLLSGELATRITGRYIDLTLFPFSFKESLGKEMQAAYTTRERAEVLKRLGEYLKTGGFPEVRNFGKAILQRIYEDVITKDVLFRYKIKKREELKRVAKYLITNFGEEISYRKLSRILGVKHVATVSNWVSYIENAYLIFRLERFSYKLKQQFIAPKKVYCIDNGLAGAMAFSVSENVGRLMENAVAVHLYDRKCSSRELEVYYWKDHAGNEVDFVLKEGNAVQQLIQVTYAGDRQEVREREIKALLKASGELGCSNLLVLTWNYEGDEKIGGKRIVFRPLWKFLME